MIGIFEHFDSKSSLLSIPKIGRQYFGFFICAIKLYVYIMPLSSSNKLDRYCEKTVDNAQRDGY